jgi:hypothetical protein
MEKDKIKVLKVLYTRMHFSANRKNRPKKIGKFTYKQFENWAVQNGFDKVYDKYIKIGKQNLRPSVDRINPLKGYFLNNMQIITQKENFDKGYKEMIITNGKPVLQISKDGKIIKQWNGAIEAYKKLGISDGNIWSVITGKRNSAGGYVWKLK